MLGNRLAEDPRVRIGLIGGPVAREICDENRAEDALARLASRWGLQSCWGLPRFANTRQRW